MKFNIVKKKDNFRVDLEMMAERSEIEVNVVGRLMSISRHYDGYTLWWGGNYGIDCKGADEVIETIEMFTSFVIEGGMNKNECYVTKETEKFMKESANA